MSSNSKSTNPETNIEDLSYYFGGHISTFPSFASEEQDKPTMNKIWRDIDNNVLSLIQRSTDGGAYAATIIEKLNALITDENEENKSLMKQVIGICSDEVNDFSTPTSPSEMLNLPGEGIPYPTKATTNLVAFQVFPAELSFSTRDARMLNIFFNGIPNIEWSRCTPYFDLSIISPGSSLDSNDKPTLLSQHLFLSNNEALNKDDKILAQATSEGGEALAGMELFTSPQTLVNGDNDYYEPFDIGDQSGISILDKFRPFMTLNGFDVSVEPAYAMEAFKTAKIKLTLHDRSRLSQISSLVRPDFYGDTEIYIEYGWSHPDAINNPKTNFIGDYINSLRCKEKYRITNSSFTFQDDNQVAIDISLAMKGVPEILSQLTTNTGGNDTLIEIKKLTDKFFELKKDLEGAGSVIEDVRGRTVLRAASSPAAALRIDEDMKKEIRTFIKRNKSEGMKELVDNLKVLFVGDDGEGGKLSELEEKANLSLQKKRNIIDNKYDAFAAPFPMPSIGGDSNNIKIYPVVDDEEPKEEQEYVSLGKLLMTYIGIPLQETGDFNEVQFIFYSFNSLSGFIRHHNIAQFPIEIEQFNSKYKAKFAPMLSTTLNRFMGFINDEFIRRESASAYGFDTLYGKADDAGNIKLNSTYKGNPSKLKSKRAEILEQAYPKGSDAQFRKPDVQFAVECVPVKKPDPNNPEKYTLHISETILRIFVYDKAATGVEPHAMLLSSLSQHNFNIICPAGEEGSTKDDEYGNQSYTSHHDGHLAKIFKYASEEGIIEKSTTSNTGADNEKDITYVKVKGKRLKEFLRKISPSCIVGSTGNPVRVAGLTSLNNPALASMRIKEATERPGVVNEENKDFPSFIQPTQLNVDMFGMPLFSYASNVFFDFNTNTTVDNYYICIGVDHKLKQGSFETSAKFINSDGFEKFRSPLADIERQIEIANKVSETNES